MELYTSYAKNGSQNRLLQTILSLRKRHGASTSAFFVYMAIPQKKNGTSEKKWFGNFLNLI